MSENGNPHPTTPNQGASRNTAHWANRALTLLVTAAITAKAVAFAASTDGLSRPVLAALTTFGIALIALAWTGSLQVRTRLLVLFLADAALSLVLIADAVFHRYYGSIIPIPVLSQSGQVGGVASSVTALLSPTDALYVIDLPLLLALLVIASRAARAALTDFKPGQHVPVTPWQARAWTAKASAILTVTGLALTGAQGWLVHQQSPTAVADRYGTKALVRAVGPLGYHVADAAASKMSRVDDGKSLDANQIALDFRLGDKAQGDRLAGVAKGKNVITIQIEAMQEFLIGRKVNGQEVTPTLNRLANGEALYWDDFYSQISQGNTSDAEFATLNGLYPLAAESAFTTGKVAAQTSLPETLKTHGFTGAKAFHGYKREFYHRDQAYPAQGFDEYHSESGFDTSDKIGLGLSDRSFYTQTALRLKTLKAPFAAHLVALTGHHPYEIPAKDKTLTIPTGQYGTVFENYLQAQAYSDRTLGLFLNDLDAAGILDQSVVVIYGDHWGEGWAEADINKFLNVKSTSSRAAQIALRKVPFAIRLPGGTHGGRQSGTAAMVDVYPTVLNLVGVPRTAAFTLGKDLLNSTGRIEGFRYYEPQGTFVTDDRMFLASPDGVYKSGQCLSRPDLRVLPVKDCQAGFDQTLATLRLSDQLVNGAIRDVNAALAQSAQ